MNPGRRPIADAERPHLAALGEHVRALRTEAGVSQRQAAVLASLTAGHVSAIERGRRRTRRSTLARLVAVLVAEHRRDVVVDELVEVAGPALAPESTYADRVARRRARRDQQARRETQAMMRETIADLRRSIGRGGPHVETRRALLAGLEATLADFTAAEPAPSAAPVSRQPVAGVRPLRLPRRGGRAAQLAAIDEWLAGRKASHANAVRQLDGEVVG